MGELPSSELGSSSSDDDYNKVGGAAGSGIATGLMTRAESAEGFQDSGWMYGNSGCDGGSREEEGGRDNDGDTTRSLAHLSNGWISVIGRQREMENAVVVAEILSYNFFAVYDGHGGPGVANACRDQLHQTLESAIRGCGRGRVDWNNVMRYCFLKMDEEVGDYYDGGNRGNTRSVGPAMAALNTTGSTAVVVVVGKKVIVVANCGDSRTVLCRGGVAMPLSRDHKPDLPDERERVEAAGGRIINWNGYRVLGVLALSRSIGDHYLKPYVISEPEVSISERTDSDAFLVIASNSLWDFVSNEFACEIVRSCFDGHMRRAFCKDGVAGSTTSEAAALLAELAMARGSKENISVIVVDLKKEHRLIR